MRQAHSEAQSSRPSGGRTPGRSRGSRTRSAPGRTVHRTGVDSRTVSPSMPTGTAASADHHHVMGLGPDQPLPVGAVQQPDRLRAVSTRTATTPSMPRSSRARRPIPARSDAS